MRVWDLPITGPTRENIFGHERLIARPALEDGPIEVNALKLTLRTRGAGWNVARIWECDVRADADQAAAKVTDVVRGGSAPSSDVQ